MFLFHECQLKTVSIQETLVDVTTENAKMVGCKKVFRRNRHDEMNRRGILISQRGDFYDLIKIPDGHKEDEAGYSAT